MQSAREFGPESSAPPANDAARAGQARAPDPVARVLSLQGAAGNRATAQLVQQSQRLALARRVELRPPGRGEASAFGRRQELVDRLNEMSPGVLYSLDNDRVLTMDVVDEDQVTPFDRAMQRYVGRSEVLPMRLINYHGHVDGQPVAFDTLEGGYVVLDDLLDSSDLSLQLRLIHLLEERLAVRSYARRLGTDMPEFSRGHRLGREAEARHLQQVIGDDSIAYVYDEERSSRLYVMGFRSRRERYWIFHVDRLDARGEWTGRLFAQMPDGRRVTIDELISLRAARVPATTAP